jgi:uncharacterized membrane protein YgcG
MPTHHLHISTGFMFMTALFVVAFVAVIFAFVRSMRKDRLDAERAVAAFNAEREALKAFRPTADQIQQVHGERLAARQAVNGAPFSHGTGYVPSTYAPAAPVYAHDPLTGLATGMLLGSALSHHDHTTIIHDSAPSYVDSSPSYSSSSSSDSGFSYSSDSSSSSSSYDSGSSGGFDASW